MSKLYKGKSAINNVGLFTNTELKKGDHVAYIDGPIAVFREFTPTISKQMLNWIGVGKYSWINTNASLFRFINHSCEPNVAHVSKRKVIALTTIPANTELTMDYSLTEAEPGWEIGPCTCGSKKCRGQIQSIMELTQTEFNKRKSYIPKLFQTIYTNSHK